MVRVEVPGPEWNRASEKNLQVFCTMVKKPKCEQCEKDAIGIQSFGCCVLYVCRDHADSHLLALKPGEKQAYDYCYFERFDTLEG